MTRSQYYLIRTIFHGRRFPSLGKVQAVESLDSNAPVFLPRYIGHFRSEMILASMLYDALTNVLDYFRQPV